MSEDASDAFQCNGKGLHDEIHMNCEPQLLNFNNLLRPLNRSGEPPPAGSALDCTAVFISISVPAY